MNWISRENNTQKTTYGQKTVVKISKLTSTETYKLKLVTFTKEGVKKTFGGDLWLVKIKSTSISFSIDLIDNMDGSYEGAFSTPQAGNYSIYITLQYSLYHGILDPPLDYFKLGSFQGFGANLPLGGDDFINASLLIKYIIVKSKNGFFHQCDYKSPDTCTHLNSKYGYWTNLEYKDCWQISDLPQQKSKIATYITPSKYLVDQLSKYNYSKEKFDTLIIYGDSMAMFFYRSIRERHICTKLFRKCQLVFTWTYVKGRYSTDYEDKYLHDGKDFNETIFFKGISDSLTDLNFHSKKNVIVINFGIHAIVNLPWERMKRLFYMFLDFIDKIKIQMGKRAPLFIWKTITEPGQVKQFRITERFMTTQRAYLWNEFTIHEACKRGLSILHVYHMSASFPNGTHDRCHYNESAFYPAEKALYNYLYNFNVK